LLAGEEPSKVANRKKLTNPASSQVCFSPGRVPYLRSLAAFPGCGVEYRQTRLREDREATGEAVPLQSSPDGDLRAAAGRGSVWWEGAGQESRGG
jgi:hypothetical protein